LDGTQFNYAYPFSTPCHGSGNRWICLCHLQKADIKNACLGISWHL